MVSGAVAAEPLIRKEWQVDGVTREALLHIPATAHEVAAPVVFAFHGHGGRMASAVRSFSMHTLWPEALVVYMQGLNTPGRLTDPEGKKPGWQHAAGDQGDRDLKFFDAVLASLKADYRVDTRRIYSMGHSNGGGFTYLLWAERGDVFAALAPSAAPATRSLSKLKPKPLMHLAGENDPLVKFEWQQATINFVRKLNQCGEGMTWDQDANCTLYPSAIGTPVVTALHPGGHEFLKDGPPLIVKFFKQHAKKE
ncbi:polyhydroxybutyrate depolymerase [Prosthecobacter debontii]|uniref:Polyhydroxybutyrate depolymerase n=2 Tax=Prosthecobacter debontii TaxID=48467 RepID=A0A1T4YT71_9BACT|nr:polyhydroxybutyrate depolymerase [Prosthecobacter debontii]